MRLFAKLLVTGMVIWLLSVVVCSLLGVSIQFPFTIIKEGEIAGFNVGMNIGIPAGQTIMWPHIHFIPRHKGDAPEIGGMRHAHPGADHKKYY